MKKSLRLLSILSLALCQNAFAQWSGTTQLIPLAPNATVTIGGGAGYVTNTTTTTKLTVQDDNTEVLIQDLSATYAGQYNPGYSSASLTLKSPSTTNLLFKNGTIDFFSIGGAFSAANGFIYSLGSNTSPRVLFNG
jgi:hypothetical protein